MKKHRNAQIILSLAVLLYFFAMFAFLGTPTLDPPQFTKPKAQVQSSNRQKANVTRVIDGDTIELSTGQKLRYIGIDTPEITGKDECFAQEAKQKNSDLVLNKEVELEKDVSETDRYGRLLRYVYVDGKMVNQTLVSQGYAKASTYPPDVRNKDLFVEAQQSAMQAKKGLWGPACPTD